MLMGLATVHGQVNSEERGGHRPPELNAKRRIIQIKRALLRDIFVRVRGPIPTIGWMNLLRGGAKLTSRCSELEFLK